MLFNDNKVMYKLDPIITYDDNSISLPKCMYKINNIHGGLQHCREDTANQLNNYIIQQKPTEITKMIEERQKKLLIQLENLRLQMLKMKQTILTSAEPSSIAMKCNKLQKKSDLPNDIVITVDPKFPPFYLLSLKKCLNLNITCHTHSSIVNLPASCTEFVKKVNAETSSEFNVNIVLIWKLVGVGTKLFASSTMPVVICGDVNILRYLTSVVTSNLSYQNLENSWELDSILDICHKLQWQESIKEKQQTVRQLNNVLGKNQWFNGGSNYSIGDVAAWHAIKQSERINDLSGNLKSWYQKCEKIF